MIKNNLLEAITRKKIIWVMILLGAFFVISLSSNVSATGSFSNYDEEVTPIVLPYGAIDVWDGNIFFPDEKVATHTLEYNSNQCLIDCSATGKTTLYRDGQLFDDLTFSKQVRNGKILIEESYEIDMGDYENRCDNVFNQSTGIEDRKCADYQTGTHTETRYRWIEYKGEVLKAGTYHWEIKAQKGIKDNVDWIAYSNNVGLTQWAWWNSSWAYKYQITGDDILASEIARTNEPYTIWINSTHINSSFCQDVRLVNSAEDTQIPIQLLANSTTQGCQIAFPMNKTAGTNVVLYAYYGNANAPLLATGTMQIGAGSTNNGIINTTVLNGVSGAGGFAHIIQLSNQMEICAGAQTNVDYMDGTGFTGASAMFYSETLTGTVLYNNSQIWSMKWQSARGGGGNKSITIYNNFPCLKVGLDYANNNFDWRTLQNAKASTTVGGNISGVFTNFTTSSWTEKNMSEGWFVQGYASAGMKYGIFNLSKDNRIMMSGAAGGSYAYNWGGQGAGGLSSAETPLEMWACISPTINYATAQNMSRALENPIQFTLGAEETNIPVYTLTINQSYPDDLKNFSTRTISFGCNYTSTGANITDVNLTIKIASTGAVSYSNKISGLNTDGYNASWTPTLSLDEEYNWTCYGSSLGVNATSGNRSFIVDSMKPVLAIQSPESNRNYSALVTIINFTATDISNHLDTCMVSSETYNTTINCSELSNSTALTSENEGTNIWTLWANDTFGNANTTSVTFWVDTLFPLVEYDTGTAVDGSARDANFVYIDVTITEANFRNMTYQLSGSSDVFYDTPTYNYNFTGLVDGTYYYNVTVCDTTSNCNITATRNIELDTLHPIFLIEYPTAINYSTNVSDLNYTIDHPSGTMDKCWYSLDGITNTSLTNCLTNGSSLESIEGYNTWYIYGNDSAANEGSASVTFFKDTIFPTINYASGTASDNSYKAQNFVYIDTSFIEMNFRNITYSIDGSDITYTSPTYNHNFTALADGMYYYNVTVCDTVGNCNITATRNITLDNILPVIIIVAPTSSVYNVPNVTLDLTVTESNLDSCWYSLNGINTSIESCIDATLLLSAGNNSLVLYANDSAGTESNSSTNHPYFMPILSLCNETNNQSIINFTFKNETVGLETVNASFISSWNYYFNTSVIRTLSYTNTNEMPSYNFCMDVGDKSLYVSPNIQYYNSVSLPRIYAPGYFATTNITTNVTLYLLPSILGQYVSFRVINNLGQPLIGAHVNASKFGVVEVSGITDGAGTITFFLNPSTEYSVCASQTGYTSICTNIVPVSTSYTINLGGSPAQTICTQGISLFTEPRLSLLNNNTNYTFNFTIKSDYWDLETWGLYLYNDSDYSFGGIHSHNADGGTIGININTEENNKIYMDYYYIIHDEDCNFNLTTSWRIEDDETGSEWSILHFFNDAKDYSDEGMFGLTSFGLTIIIFLIIFLITGFMAYSFGITSPGLILVMVFLLTVLFNPVLGMMGDSIFPTIFIGLITFAVFWRELSQ